MFKAQISKKGISWFAAWTVLSKYGAIKSSIMPFEDCDCEKIAIYINVFSHFYAVSFLTALIAISSARLLSSSPIKFRKNHWLDFLKGTKLLIIIFQYWLTTSIVRSNWNLNMYFTLETTKCDKKNIINYSYHMTVADCASDPIPNNVNGNVSIDVTGTRSVPAGESCVRL